MGTLANVKIGVCTVSYKGVDLGFTKGGITVAYKPEYADVAVDQYGMSIIDKVLTKEAVEIKVPLAETQIAILAKAIPTSTSTGTVVKFGSQAGARLSDVAGELILHPQNVTGTGEDVVVYKAVIASEVSLEYTVDNQRVIELTFEALMDTTRTNGAMFGHIGTLS